MSVLSGARRIDAAGSVRVPAERRPAEFARLGRARRPQHVPCAAGRGFSWQLADSSFQGNVQFVRQTFSNGPIDKDGADGVQHFYFKATAPGTATIKFSYVQPFQKSYPEDARKTAVTVRIEESSLQK